MLWFGTSVMDDGFVYNIHHSSLTYPSLIPHASKMHLYAKKKSCVHFVSLNGTWGFP